MTKIMEKKRWEIHKLFILIQLSVFPLLGIWIVNTRNWATLRPSRVCNVTIDVVGMIVMLILFCICVKDRSDVTLRTGFFTFMISVNAMALFFDLCSWCVDELPSLRVLNYIVNTGYYGAGIAITMLFWHYLIEVSGLESKRLTVFTYTLNIGALLSLIALIGNLFGHYYFSIDSNGVYIRSVYNAACHFFPVTMILCLFILILRMDIAKGKKRALMTFISAPMVATIFQMTFYGSSVIYIGMTFAMLIIYGNVFSEQNRELAEKKLVILEKEKEILLAQREQERMETELSLASSIQTHVLPMNFPPFPEHNEFSLFASMVPARQVGGDFYDFFFVDERHLALVIADVSGKGVPAALYMMTAKTMIKNAAMQQLSPKQLLEFVNKQLCESADDVEMFVTAWVGIVDIKTGKMLAANAGHEYPAVCTSDGSFALLKDKHGLVLGAMENSVYREYELQLQQGDTIYVYTDGVVEAADEEFRLFGSDNMLAALNKAPHADPTELLGRVKADIDVFVGDTEQFDDITMLAFKMEKREDTSMTEKLCIEPTKDSMLKVQAMIEGMMEKAELPMSITAKVGVVVDEIYSNIIQYSNASKAEITCTVADDRLVLHFADDGEKYNPLDAEEPDITLPLQDREPGGLGVLLYKRIMDDVTYEYADGKNQLHLMKSLKPVSSKIS